MTMPFNPHAIGRALAAWVLLLSTPLLHANTDAYSLVDDMDLVGEARMKVLFWDVYDARLYAPMGSWSREGPYALSLTYLRELAGDKIAERSIQEIRKQGFSDERKLARWYEELIRIIPDVRKESEITGIADENFHTRFYLDGELIGEVPEADFTRAFFGIWLDEKTSEPALRELLLGGKA